MIKNNRILAFFLVILLFFVVLVYRNWTKSDFMPANENMILINIGNKDSPLFLKTKVWGISGNHEQIVLSKSDKNVANKTEDYIFYTSEIFYKVAVDSTIIIYAPESSISEPINKIQKVLIKGLKTADEIRDYNINYPKYGLKRFSVYN